MDNSEHPYLLSLADTEPVGWGWRGLLLLVWFVASFGGMYFVRDLERIQVFGWPLGYWLAAQGLILGYVVIVALYAWLANRRERRLQAGASARNGGEDEGA